MKKLQDWISQGHSFGAVHLQQHIVELESNPKEYEDAKAGAKARITPVVGRLSLHESAHVDRRPEPPGTLKSDNHPERASRPGLERDFLSIKPTLSNVSASFEWKARVAQTPKTLMLIMVTTADKKEPSALDRTVNHTMAVSISDLDAEDHIQAKYVK